jgi:hypothetical protein
LPDRIIYWVYPKKQHKTKTKKTHIKEMQVVINKHVNCCHSLRNLQNGVAGLKAAPLHTSQYGEAA